MKKKKNSIKQVTAIRHFRLYRVGRQYQRLQRIQEVFSTLTLVFVTIFFSSHSLFYAFYLLYNIHPRRRWVRRVFQRRMGTSLPLAFPSGRIRNYYDYYHIYWATAVQCSPTANTFDLALINNHYCMRILLDWARNSLIALRTILPKGLK